MGTGKVTVEHLGLKDCPRCDGQGNIEEQPQDPFGQPQQDPNGMQPNGTPPQVNQNPNGDQQTYTEPSEAEGQPVQNLEEPQEEQPLQQMQAQDQSQQSQLERPFEQESLKKKLACQACPKSVKQFESWVGRKIKVLQNKRRGKKRASEGVGLLFGLPTISKEGKKIKGVLAYAGVSLNNRIYLPEELAKGDGMTLPLLLNHSNIAGAEEELDRLEDDMRGSLENGKDFKIGWVTLRWEPDELTLYYEGVIEHPFFQKEVDDANMAVSLGIWYDSDSPQVCDVECYTLIRGAEFREVSLVYHPGFPIATIEAVEQRLKFNAKKQIAHEVFDHYINDMDKAIDIGTAQTGVLSQNITFTTDGTDNSFSTQVIANERDYRLQPKMSLPKTTGDLKIPNKPDVISPQDSMKEKEKASEDDIKKKLKNLKRKSTQEMRMVNSHLRGVLHNLG